MSPHHPNPREQLENAVQLRTLAEKNFDDCYDAVRAANEELIAARGVEELAKLVYEDWKKETGQE